MSTPCLSETSSSAVATFSTGMELSLCAQLRAASCPLRIGAEELVRIGNDQRLPGQLVQTDGGMGHERVPGGEHEIGFVPAHKQLRAELLLHALNVLGEGGLGEEERLRRPAEAECSGQHRELVEVLGLRGAIPPFMACCAATPPG